MAAIEPSPPTTKPRPLPPPQSPSSPAALRLLDTKRHLSPRLLRQTHAYLIKHSLSDNNYVASILLKHYFCPSFRAFGTALKVFDQVPQPNALLWNSLIRACVDNKASLDAIVAFHRMVVHGSTPDKYTFPLLLKACTATEAFVEGMQFYAYLVKRGLGQDRYIASAAIQMYAASGMLIEARRVLAVVGDSDPVCWNAMIDGYMKHGETEAAREVFDAMLCKNIGSWNAMITGYARNGMIKMSRTLFDEMPQRDEVSWSAIIDGYAQCGRANDALEIFRRMVKEGVALNKFVLSSVLAACASAGTLGQGEWIHAYIERNSFKLDPVLGTSLVDMYAKCGRLDLAKDVFDKMQNKNVFSWNAIIGAFAIHGHATEAIDLFSQMQRENKPNAITFIGLLNACAHAGLIEEGYKYFDSMEEEFGVTPTVEHYGCMVDLLGRAGLFKKAERMINSMPLKPNAAVWGALLGACKKHGNIELGKKVGEVLLELEPENSGRYVLLSNIYAKAGRWDDVSKLRKLMKDRGIKTLPGISWMELDGVVNEFKVGDSTHKHAKEINSKLKEMMNKLALQGYIPNTSEVLFDIDEEEKESAIYYHSEKLAIAFGLLSTTPGTTIRIMKNLRVCEDCHAAMKLISQMSSREIVVRDRARFHHFRDGKCSCMDFW